MAKRDQQNDEPAPDQRTEAADGDAPLAGGTTPTETGATPVEDVPEQNLPPALRAAPEDRETSPSADLTVTDPLATVPDGAGGVIRAETVRPRRYTAGEPADRAIYGERLPDGSIRALDGEPEPGQRGVILVQKGDAITAEAVAAVERAEREG